MKMFNCVTITLIKLYCLLKFINLFFSFFVFFLAGHHAGIASSSTGELGREDSCLMFFFLVICNLFICDDAERRFVKGDGAVIDQGAPCSDSSHSLPVGY